MTFLIFEGCDGVGKTHLVNQVWETLHSDDSVVLHRGPPTRHPLVEYELSLEVLYEAEPRPVVICDRWHWGELIYGPLYRHGSLLEEAGCLHIEMWLAARGGHIFHVTEDRPTIKERLEAKGETYLQLEDVDRVWTEYRARSYAVSPCQRSTISSNDLSVVLNTPLHDVTPPASYVGPPKPRYLLVGDRRHAGARSTHRAAFVPYPSTSGRYLLDSLPMYMRPITGLVNSDQDEITHEEFLAQTALDGALVVALGRRAHENLSDMGVAHGVVPHPQYVRRFHHVMSVDYGHTILKTAHSQEDNIRWPNL